MYQYESPYKYTKITEEEKEEIFEVCGQRLIYSPKVNGWVSNPALKVHFLLNKKEYGGTWECFFYAGTPVTSPVYYMNNSLARSFDYKDKTPTTVLGEIEKELRVFHGKLKDLVLP